MKRTDKEIINLLKDLLQNRVVLNPDEIHNIVTSISVKISHDRNRICYKGIDEYEHQELYSYLDKNYTSLTNLGFTLDRYTLWIGDPLTEYINIYFDPHFRFKILYLDCRQAKQKIRVKILNTNQYRTLNIENIEKNGVATESYYILYNDRKYEMYGWYGLERKYKCFECSLI